MKILYITPYYKPSWFYGGPPKCIAEQAESLQKNANIHLEVVTLNLNGNQALYPNITSPVVVETNKVKVHYLPVADNMIGKKYFIGKGMNSYLQKFKDFDLVHVHTLFNFVSRTGMAFASDNKIPFVITPHGMLDEVALSRSSFLKKIHRFFYEDRLLDKAKFVQFTTNGELKDAVLRRSSNVGVIPLGVQFEASIKSFVYRTDNVDNSVFRFVFLGRINRIKGIGQLLAAFSKLDASLKNKIHLDVYGDDDDNYLSELLLYKKEYELSNVRFMGKLEPVLRDFTLSQYDALILTSFLESFGLVVVEALDLGLPVLITDRVKLADFVIANKCGWVAPQDVEAIALTIEAAYLTSIQIRQEMGERGAKAVRENFSLDKVTADLISLYRS